MKIAHLIYSFTTGGSETMLVDIANQQAEQTDVSIVIINKIYNQALVDKIDKRVKIYFINRTKSSKNPYPIIKLNVLLLGLGPDVLHCHNHNIIPLLVSSLKKKAVLTVHDVGVNTKYFGQFNQLFAISNTVKKDIQNRSGINATLIYNGICISDVIAKETYNFDKSFKILIISRLMHEKKGQHLAIEALHFLKKKGIRNIYLDLIGSGNSEHYLKELTNIYRLNEQVSFLGLKDRDYIYVHLKDYDLLIQPSLFEGFGLTVAEGMAAKLPVLVSNIDGPMEIIENGRYGYCFQSGNSMDLAEKIISILKNYSTDQSKNMIENAYIHLKNNFDISTTAKSYLFHYRPC